MRLVPACNDVITVRRQVITLGKKQFGSICPGSWTYAHVTPVAPVAPIVPVAPVKRQQVDKMGTGVLFALRSAEIVGLKKVLYGGKRPTSASQC